MKDEAKQSVNELSMEKLEAMLSEEMEEMSLYDCTVNWSCTNNGSK